MAKSLLSFWKRDGITGVGNRALLEQPLTDFFASRRCSGRAIRAAMDWAVTQARMKTPLTADLAMRRNDWIAHHSAHIVVAEAVSGGSLASCIVAWKNERKRVSVLLDEVRNQ